MCETSARSARALARVCAIAILLTGPVFAASLPVGFTENAVVANGSLPSGTAMQFAPDGRLFVALQTGQLRVIKNGALLATPFVTLTVNSDGERGLLGVAFDPNFAANQYVYVYYTVPGSPPHNRVSRFTASGDVAVPGSELPILDLENLSATNHNGGAIDFGPDGKLYVAVGENANGANSQSLANRLGKMLRINSDGSLPNDNPTSFSGIAGSPTGLNRAIWAVGLRNPYTLAFNPGGPAPAMLINDVGQSTWEEVDDGIAGANYGWPNSEGPTTNVNYVSPRVAYGHGNTASTGCAITGGAFYNPATQTFPTEYLNDYFFADYCTGWIRRLDPATNAVVGFATGAGNPVDLKVGSDGHLYYLSRGSGTVFRVRYTGGPAQSVRLTLATSPSGLQVRLDGAPVTAPYAFDSVVGTPHTIEAFAQTAAGTTYAFVAWSDGGPAARAIVTPAAAATYTATYQVTSPSGLPAAPTGLAAVVNGGTLHLSWNRSAGAQGYRLEAGTATGLANLAVLDVGDVASVEGLVPPGPYFVRVRAVNGAGVSGASNEAAVTVSSTAACTTPPPPPTGYTAQTGGLFVALAWSASPAATSYLLEAGLSSGAANLGVLNLGRVTTFQSPVPAGTYFTRIRAANACGVSAPSAEVPFTTGCAQATPPLGLTVTKAGGAATFTWLPPLGATAYRLQVGTAPGLTNLADLALGAATTLPVGLAGVPAGTYYVRVVAVSACGVSAPSNEVALSVP